MLNVQMCLQVQSRHSKNILNHRNAETTMYMCFEKEDLVRRLDETPVFICRKCSFEANILKTRDKSSKAPPPRIFSERPLSKVTTYTAPLEDSSCHGNCRRAHLGDGETANECCEPHMTLRHGYAKKKKKRISSHLAPGTPNAVYVQSYYGTTAAVN